MMKREEYETKIAAMEPLTDDQRKHITCALLGHSHITMGCFGYVYCARCGDQIGDVLGGAFYDPSEVRVGHNCPICRKNYERLGWEDKILTPDPFGLEAAMTKLENDLPVTMTVGQLSKIDECLKSLCAYLRWAPELDVDRYHECEELLRAVEDAIKAAKQDNVYNAWRQQWQEEATQERAGRDTQTWGWPPGAEDLELET